MTEPPSRRRSRSSEAQPVMGDHPELETDETQRTDLAPDRGGRSSVLVPGTVLRIGLLVLVVLIIIALVLFFV